MNNLKKYLVKRNNICITFMENLKFLKFDLKKCTHNISYVCMYICICSLVQVIYIHIYIYLLYNMFDFEFLKMHNDIGFNKKVP